MLVRRMLGGLIGTVLAASFAIPLAAAQDWKAEWQKTVDAADAEGTLILYSQPNQAARDFILREFPKQFPKIAVNLSVMGSPEFLARIRTERAAGQYLWDVALEGAGAGYTLAHDSVLDPVMDEFIDPEIKNPDLWGGWDQAFVDVGQKYVFAMSQFIAGPWYDALHIPPDKVAKEGLNLLLDPEYKDKIAWFDPSVIGAGQPYSLLLRTKLGDDALKKIVVDQKPIFNPEQFQTVEAIARGTAWIGIGPPVRSLIQPYVQQGVKADVRAFGPETDRNVEEIGGSGLFVFKNRPHPNATKVFVNWLLSKDVQYNMAKALDQSSRRGDLPPTTLPDETPIKGAVYVRPQREDTAPALYAAVGLVAEDRKLAK